MVKFLPKIRESQIKSVGQEDPLKKEMEIQSRILSWEIPWTEERNKLQPMGLQRVGQY